MSLRVFISDTSAEEVLIFNNTESKVQLDGCDVKLRGKVNTCLSNLNIVVLYHDK